MVIPLLRILPSIRQKYQKLFWRNLITPASTEFKDIDLTHELKKKIESHWRERINVTSKFNTADMDNKYYVLSMFPYPSGHLHMGHVRVYTISDAMARFYRLKGRNVLHPMGWDAFGLPAENAAIQRNIPADRWTNENIAHMKEQLEEFGCSFDWDREISTCDSNYYRWTQELFLKLFSAGLAYQKEALVNWDPIDKTVLADEQVDANGCSWRSGAKVEKKVLKQWFIKTTKFAKQLYDGLSDPTLEDWKDIVTLQKHWIGECNGYSFDLQVKSTDSVNRLITVWTDNPKNLNTTTFIAIKPENILNENKVKEGILHHIKVQNPFNETLIPVIVTNDLDYPHQCDCCFGLPNTIPEHSDIAKKLGLPETEIVRELSETELLSKAQELNIGGYPVSSKLRDWLISRQRYWGAPIPVVHCEKCGTVPVPSSDLPLLLLKPNETEINIKCPNCGDDNAKRETDTMDTFVDSSWYYLRFIDVQNNSKMFNEKLAHKVMPVDLYIGGKEHAVLHLYYARFVNHFLNSLGLTGSSEPFKRLLVQGMVMGRSFRVKGSGKYLKEEQVDIIDTKKNKAIEKATGNQVVMQWEKMSKSKQNGVDPADMIRDYSVDTTRLIMLADVAPMSHRNWSSATFPGVLNWQKRLWLTLNEFYEARILIDSSQPSPNITEGNNKMFDARNYYTKGATFHYKHTHQLSVAISKMQGLTNSIRRATKEVLQFSGEYERALGSQIIMLSPIAPHFASELWAKFASVPYRINTTEFKWDEDVLQQSWPEVDSHYCLDLIIKVNGIDNCVVKLPRNQMDVLTYKEAIDIAMKQERVIEFVTNCQVTRTNFNLYPGCDCVLNIYTERPKKQKAVIQ